MRRILRRLFLVTALLLPVSAAHADNYLSIGAGWFDFNRSGDNSTNFSGEWRGEKLFYDLRPIIGLSVNTDGGTLGYAGFDYDWQVVPHWFITPSLAAGAWHDGSSIDLGGTFEFHEAIEGSYEFYNGYRVGVEVTHTSNAGIYSSNPGVNTLMAKFALPL